MGDLIQKGAHHRLAVHIGAQLGKNHADRRAVFIPSLDVRVPGGMREGIEYLVQSSWITIRSQEPGGFEEHEDEAPAGPLGPFSLQVQHPHERLGWENPARTLRGRAGFSKVRLSVAPV